jgi:dipeptidyl aminopeptidase/acylaminoacyl peptidase
VSAEDVTYRKPPQVVADILTAARVPRGAPSVSPDGARLVLPELPSLLPIGVLAEPVDKLAGLEILPAYHCTRNQLKFALTGFSIAPVAKGAAVRAKLPDGARIGAIAWSNKGDRLACVAFGEGGGALWIVDAATGAAHALDGVRAHTVMDARLDWTLDDKAIVTTLVDDQAPASPPEALEPTGPRVRVGAGKATPQRTSRDVLRTPTDQQRFSAATRSRLAVVPVDGDAPRAIGESGVFYAWTVSPDDRNVVVETGDDFPLGFPYGLFPSDVEIRSMDGGAVAKVGTMPLNDRSAISSVASLGPRTWGWAPDGSALYYFSWQDTPGADFAKAIRDTTLPQPGTDRLMRLDAPFKGEPVQVATSDFQFAEMGWTGGGKALVLRDAYDPRRRERVWWIDPKSPEKRTTLYARSTEGVYDAPGRPLTRSVGHARQLWTSKDGGAIYLAGDGFRADGQRPFLDRVELGSGKHTRVFESAGDVLEQPVAVLSDDGKRFVTLRQSNKQAPNYYARTAGQKSGRQLSDYRDPAPALTASHREQFKFKRPDGVELNAEVVLPADWKQGQRLPTVFWVYPNDYRSAAAASQNRRSPNRFPSQSPLNPEVLVTQGYAVVYPDIAVVGTNDKYVDEIGVSARAAVDEAVRRGWCDRERIGVGGHSYGAFSSANLLAHTDLFKAGIASDGAYNRTLTPFTFQAEERTLWQAPDVYLKMSPFLSADHIDRPLLLLHNLDDTNVGTNPIQSERMFDALNGLGKTVTLIEYPYEDHGPAARESVLDYWARVIEWYDRYVKSGAAASKAVQ